MNMKWIDEIIMGLIDTYNTRNPYELCEALNISIVKISSNHPLLKNQPSMYIRSFFGKGKEIIFISNTLYYSYEKFYLMHELGHAILHPYIQNSLNETLINIDKLEKQANYFAFKLANLAIDSIDMENLTLEQIASCLEVPEKALKQLVNI